VRRDPLSLNTAALQVLGLTRATRSGRLLAACSGKAFRDRRDIAIIRLFLDTGMRLKGMGGLRYSTDDPDSSDVDLRRRVVRIIAKGRHEMVLPIGPKVRVRLTGISAPRCHAS